MQDLIQRDLQHIWHPCSQMQDYESFPPLVIEKARGSYLHLKNGQCLIDAISSWWCKIFGHNHPRLKRALQQQMERFEHVIFANTTHDVIVELSEHLATLQPGLNKVMYASDGCCAVEIALKMSLHARKILGQPQRRQFMALSHSYHGETCGALSVSDEGRFREPYLPMLMDVPFIDNIPYVTGRDDPLWQDCSEQWPAIEKQLACYAETATAIIVEPIAQGAGGLLIYSADFLRRLHAWCQANEVHLIADEIMTGLGRTGLLLACQHANIMPDFLCLSKALTGGWLPLSATLTTDAIYDLFYADYAEGKSFLHSHTHAGNALAASVALETLKMLQEEPVLQQAQQLESDMRQRMKAIAEQTQQLSNVRAIGGIVAADLIQQQPRLGYKIFQAAVKHGAYLRPMGNTVYWLPPLNISTTVLDQLQQITAQAIKESC